jgi:hypothetical protein
MKRKASFLGIPCFYDNETGSLDARYGKINDWILSAAIEVWWFLGTIFESCAGYFPIEIHEEKES